MANYTISFQNDDTGRTRQIAEAPTLVEARQLRVKKASAIIKRQGMDAEDELAALEEIRRNKNKWVEWNGLHFFIEKVA